MSEPTDDELRVEIAKSLGWRNVSRIFAGTIAGVGPWNIAGTVPHWPTDPAAAMALLDCEQLKECHFELERDEEWIASIGAHIAFANTPARAISRVALKALEGMKAEAQ